MRKVWGMTGRGRASAGHQDVTSQDQQLSYTLEFVPPAAAVMIYVSKLTQRCSVPQPGLPPLRHLEKNCHTDSDYTVATPASAIFIIMEDTRGKINGAVVDFIMVISPQPLRGIEVAGLFLK